MHISQISGYGYESGDMTVSVTLTDNDTGIAMNLRQEELIVLQNTLVRFYEARQEEVSILVRDMPVTTKLIPAPINLNDDEIPF